MLRRPSRSKTHATRLPLFAAVNSEGNGGLITCSRVNELCAPARGTSAESGTHNKENAAKTLRFILSLLLFPNAECTIQRKAIQLEQFQRLPLSTETRGTSSGPVIFKMRDPLDSVAARSPVSVRARAFSMACWIERSIPPPKLTVPRRSTVPCGESNRSESSDTRRSWTLNAPSPAGHREEPARWLSRPPTRSHAAPRAPAPGRAEPFQAAPRQSSPPPPRGSSESIRSRPPAAFPLASRCPAAKAAASRASSGAPGGPPSGPAPLHSGDPRAAEISSPAHPPVK